MTLRPYTAANRRRYPNVGRARRQIERAAYLRPCPVCRHPEVAHAIEDGQRVCSRGERMRISCVHCAELWARMPAVAALTEFARVLGTPVPRRRAVGARSGR
ncbi:hypothetical protein [Kitasatospora indigofera]|uniref:hypothetical protein n=1 Tax=Kitasatospora indigofera TaxID=67307 RepID=UPI0033B2C249